MPDAPTLFLIDGSSQMYRAYHAFRGRGLSNQEGNTTHAVYVFVTMLRKLIKDHAPAYLTASFDLAGPTFRDQARLRLQSDARGHARRPRRADQMGARGLRGARRTDRDRRRLRGRRRHRHAGAAGARSRLRRRHRLDRQGFLPDGRAAASASTIRAKTARGSTRRGVVEKFGVKPDQVVDVLALVGDTSDNVAGVPGIGKKGAIDLITQYGHLDALIARAGELKPKQREALQTHREDALRSRELVTIRTDVPVDVDFDALRYRGGSRERCYELFTRLDFRTLVAEYAPTADTIEKDYALVDTPDALDALVADLEAAGEFAFRVIPDRPSATFARHRRASRSPPAIDRRATCRWDTSRPHRSTTCWAATRRRRRSPCGRRSSACVACSRTSGSARSATT